VGGKFEGSGSVQLVESSTTLILGEHFLLTCSCSDTFAVGRIV